MLVRETLETCDQRESRLWIPDDILRILRMLTSLTAGSSVPRRGSGGCGSTRKISSRDATGTMARQMRFTHHGTQKNAHAHGIPRMSRISTSLSR